MKKADSVKQEKVQAGDCYKRWNRYDKVWYILCIHRVTLRYLYFVIYGVPDEPKVYRYMKPFEPTDFGWKKIKQ